MEEETIIYETDFWKVLLSPNQAYLGSCIIVLKRDCRNMSDLKPDEWINLHKNIVKVLEPTLKKAFNATMFNWTCLMNDAFKSKKPKPSVHWHLRPRYRKEIRFAGEQFQDLEFAHHYDKRRKMLVSKKVLKEISKEIQKYLSA
jgi:diadenosine tetraphosphate (Ap4A) HIT family hydrolase